MGPLARLRGAGARAALGLRALRATGLTQAFAPRAVARLLLDARGQKLGPHLAVMLHARHAPEREAVVVGDRRLDYGAFDRAINQLGHALVARGVGPGDRVAILLPNGAELLIAVQALARIGAVAAQLGSKLKRGELEPLLANAQPAAIVTHVDHAAELDAALAARGEAPPRIVVGADGPDGWDAALTGLDGARPPRRKGGDAGGVIVYTSGTTGTPRGARRGWSKTGVQPALDLLTALGARPDERHLVLAPLYHSGAMGFSMLTLLVGGALVIEEGFEPVAALAAIERHGITSFFAVPTMLERLIAVPAEQRERFDLSSLRWVLSSAAPLTTETARRFQDAFGPVLWNLYGATETGLVSLAGPRDHAAHPGTVGRPLAGNRIHVLDDRGHPLATGEVGELFVENDMLVEGYHEDDAATAASSRAGGFSVGDLGRLDADGYLYVVSRTHDMIISGGVNIYPAELEAALASHPDVVEAAVLGAPDPEWGEVVVAFVVPRAGAELRADEVVAFSRTVMADFKRPRRVELVAELPRNATGKVLKRVLRDQLGALR